MFDDNMDLIIRKSLIRSAKNQAKRSPGCLSDCMLSEYVNAIAGGEVPEEEASLHIDSCEYCFSRAADAISSLTSYSQSLRAGEMGLSAARAKALPKRFPRIKSDYFTKNVYLFICAFFFALSFMLPRYFVQFLVASIITGFKWVMDTGGSKALIMIYDVWQAKKQSNDDDREDSPISKNRR